MGSQRTKKLDNQTEENINEEIHNEGSNVDLGVISPERQHEHIPKSVDQVIDELIEFIDKYSEIAKSHGNSSDYAKYIAFKSALLKVLLSYKNE